LIYVDTFHLVVRKVKGPFFESAAHGRGGTSGSTAQHCERETLKKGPQE